MKIYFKDGRAPVDLEGRYTVSVIPFSPYLAVVVVEETTGAKRMLTLNFSEVSHWETTPSQITAIHQ